MSRNSDTINYLNRMIDTLRETVEVARDEASDLRREVHALQKGIETRYEVTTVAIGGTGARDVRGFEQIVDALHWAADKRIGEAFDRVTIVEVESRRQALYPNGDVVRPFGT